MGLSQMIVAISLVISASAAEAAQPDPALVRAAPAGTPDTKYCMRIEAITGGRIEKIECWTREEWANNGVDVDMDWAKEGVRTAG